MTMCDIGVLDDYVSGGAHQVRVGGRVLVVVRIENDVYVLDDRCSHEECARHGAMFRLSDGEPTSFPATRPVAHYEVRSNDGRLEVSVP
jgi:3-phenylpropionate/trans-cinnamate dioxygenase ferredoxin subunit